MNDQPISPASASTSLLAVEEPAARVHPPGLSLKRAAMPPTTGSPAVKPTGRRLSSLDGWRALSILLVLGDHSQLVAGFPRSWTGPFGWIFDGNLGVRFFFVISGFLITHLLVRENQNKGRISLRDFYIRRALRILPVYYVFLLAAFGLAIFGGFHQSSNNWAANLTFTTNFFPRTWTTGHLWSLSVEEQFYLLWPACLVLAGGRKSGSLVYWILGLPILLAPFCRVISHKHVVSGIWGPLFSTYSFFNYFDSLAVGCIAAILWARQEARISTGLSRRPMAACGAAFLFILIPHALGRGLLPWYLTVPFVPTLQAVGFVVLLLASISFPQRFQPLNWKIVRQIGILSYSIYIWQQIFCGDPAVFGLSSAPWMSFPWWLGPVFLVAGISYFGLEKPLMDLRSRFR
jgi:peptidoglycan/LPS O-acetylase OafA/YrhL